MLPLHARFSLSGPHTRSRSILGIFCQWNITIERIEGCWRSCNLSFSLFFIVSIIFLLYFFFTHSLTHSPTLPRLLALCIAKPSIAWYGTAQQCHFRSCCRFCFTLFFFQFLGIGETSNPMKCQPKNNNILLNTPNTHSQLEKRAQRWWSAFAKVRTNNRQRAIHANGKKSSNFS